MTRLGTSERVCYWQIADIDAGDEHVRFWGKADIPDPLSNVR